MWQGLDLIPHSPTLVQGETYHPDAVEHLQALGREYEDCGGVIVVTPHMYNEDAFPVNPADPLQEKADWEGFFGVSDVQLRRWDGLPFMAEALQRSARRFGVPVAAKPGPIDHSIWAPLRWMFPPSTAMPLLPVGVSGLGPRSHYKMGRAIRDAVENAHKPIAVLVSSNLTHRPDLLRWDARELPAEARVVDDAILRGLRENDWSRFERLEPRQLRTARPEASRNLWSMLRGLTAGLRGELRYYGNALGAYGMALVHFEPPHQNAA